MTVSAQRNNRLGINFIATVIQMVLNYAISFMLTPFIVESVGSEAYGFVSLGNNLVNYATIVTVALNSVAGRFITISIHQGRKEEGNRYFNSVLWANVFLAGIVAAVFAIVIMNLENIFDVPPLLVEDVRQLFIFIVINFIITIVCNVFTVATFVTNELYLTNIGNCIGAILRVLVIVFMYKFLPLKVAYVGFSSVVCTVFISIYNFVVTKKSSLGLSVNISKFSFTQIRELFAAGVWNSVTKLSQILSDGLDLLISNLFISAAAMGALSVAYTIPTLFSAVVGTISGIFSPQQTYYYAKNDMDGVVAQIKLNMKMNGFFVSVILAGFIAFGKQFFDLWVPSQNTLLIYELAIIASTSVVVTGVTSCLNNVFLLTNRLKTNSIVWLLIGVFDAALAFILVKYTSLWVFAVAGVSKVVGLIVNLTYLPIYSSKCLKIPVTTFYPTILMYLRSFVLLLMEMFVVNYLLSGFGDTFIFFLFKCAVAGGTGCALNYMLFLNKDERAYLKSKMLSKFKG